MNARFWTYWNGGMVKLTLRPGASMTLRQGGSTDEGYFYEEETLVHDGSGVVSHVYSRGRDCDGHHEHYSSHFCPIPELKGRVDDDGVPRPAWVSQGSRQRDYTAEASGY